jgi:hypothetical protein
MRACSLMLSSLLLLKLLPCHSWSPPTSTATGSYARSIRTRLYDALESDFYFSSERPLSLSPDDLDRLSKLRNRQKTLPLLICQDSLLPGQTMELGSADAKFQHMCRSIRVDDELALVGMHPYKAGEPLTVGVTVVVEQKTTNVLKVKAKEVVDVQGQPWWDSTKSCFITHLEVAQDDMVLKGRHYQQAKEWFDELPVLVKKWWDVMGSNDDIPHTSTTADFTERSLAVAALLNPSRPRERPVSLEIRPALLACRNDHDRLYLVHAALQASLQHLTGTEPLF